ncbi:TerD family protein [Acidithiobacillus ferrivorans]|nr:TerD family protein [Acidithiobacillus ferrivorans]
MAAIVLKKGEPIHLSKDHGLTHVNVELTFDVDRVKFPHAHEMDIGVSGFCLRNVDGKPAAPLGADGSADSAAFVFYGNRSFLDGAVTHDADGGSIGDDKMHIDFTKLLANQEGVVEVSIVAEIYEGLLKNHHFGMVNHCTVHITNADTNEVIAEFPLSDQDSENCAVQMGSFTMAGGHVAFTAVGKGYDKGLADFLRFYGWEVADDE